MEPLSAWPQNSLSARIQRAAEGHGAVVARTTARTETVRSRGSLVHRTGVADSAIDLRPANAPTRWRSRDAPGRKCITCRTPSDESVTVTGRAPRGNVRLRLAVRQIP